MPMRRQMQNKGELAVMVVCVVVGFLLAAQLRSVKLAGAADATNASRLARSSASFFDLAPL